MPSSKLRVPILVLHGLAVVWFTAIATGLVSPLWNDPAHTILGSNLGDNVSFVWNFWWAGHAMASPDASLFSTDALFAPIGTSLLLHTGTPLLTVVSALLLPGLEPVASYNLWIWLSLLLNGICTYAAAYQATKRQDAALLAGTIFALAPFLAVRVNGHLNVLSAWVLPLFVVAIERLYRQPSPMRAGLAGAALGITAYVDYYYAIYAAIFGAMLYASRRWMFSIVLTRAGRYRTPALCLLGAALVVVCLIGLAVLVTGGGEMTAAGRRLRLNGTFNIRLAAWVLSLLVAAAYFAPRFERMRQEPGDDASIASFAGTRAPHLIVLLAVALALTLPLLIGTVHLWQSGDYISPQRFWRSATPGLDVTTVLLGNPTSALFGTYPQRIYELFEIDEMESVGWLGVVPTVLVCLAVLRLRALPEIRRWLIVLALFGVWSLGPYLTVLGENSAFMLPQMFLRFIPIVNNARMPGRAFAVVFLAAAMIAAIVVARRTQQSPKPWAMAAILTLAVVLDFWPRPYEAIALDRPAIYDQLKSAAAPAPRRALLELPIGIRDGFGERGRFDDESLFHQMHHGKPIVGGFVARLSPRITDGYERDYVFGQLLGFAEGAEPGQLDPPEKSLVCAVGFVSMPSDADEKTRAFIGSIFNLRPLAANAARSVFEVVDFHAPYCKEFDRK
jgi:hypothetical protein